MSFLSMNVFKYASDRPGFSRLLFNLNERLRSRKIGQRAERFIHQQTLKLQDTRPPWQSQICSDQLKLMNFTMSVNEEKVQATVHTWGLNYSDFDAKSGQPKPHQLLNLTESARFFLHHWPLDVTGRTFRDYARLTSDRMTFLVSSRFDITEDMYTVKVPKNPLDVVIQGGHVGNTSLSSIAEVFTKDRTQLLTNITHVVSIDNQTRRPLPLPDWWTDKYAKFAESHKPLKFEKQTMPSDLEPYKIHVVRSDLDGNGHTNWSCYVRFGVDGIYNFCKRGKLPGLANIDSRMLKSMELMYAGESFDEDVLDVYVWSTYNTDVAMVHIYHESEFIFQGQFEYFPAV